MALNKANTGRAVCNSTALLFIVFLALWSFGWPTRALAHSAERGFIMLLPTGYYLVGGAAAVLVTFLLLALASQFAPKRAGFWRGSVRLAPIRHGRSIQFACNLLAFGLFMSLLAVGFFGTRDPLKNLLTLTIWTFWWVGLTLAQALFGNIWALINPWQGPYDLARRLLPSGPDGPGLLPYPAWLSHWPAVILFTAFAWFELVYLAPNDPEHLAFLALGYWALTLIGMALFGGDQWLAKAECFSLFFRLIANLAPFGFRTGQTETGQHPGLALNLPGARALKMSPLPFSGTLFILLTLATVSFDGLSKSFWWLAQIGINPLAFPGRSAVTGVNSFGLILVWVLLAGAYLLAIWLGWRLSKRSTDLSTSLGLFAISILPISLGYHFAHYLTLLLVNGQYFWAALSDPFALGWDLLSLGDFHVTTSFLNHRDGVEIIWRCQAAAIIIAHVAAVLLAHALALRLNGDHRSAVLSEIPLAVLMLAYTLFGLWLLSTPVAA